MREWTWCSECGDNEVPMFKGDGICDECKGLPPEEDE